MKLESELENARKKYKETKAVIEKLKKFKRKDLDELFFRVHDQVFEDIDCRECGNCCKTLGPRVTNRDIQKISKYINMRAGKVVKFYLDVDEDNDFVFNQMPCPFLEDGNFCKIYDARPRACEEFPHTDLPNMQKKLHITLKNSLVCPAVFRMIELIKEEI